MASNIFLNTFLNIWDVKHHLLYLIATLLGEISSQGHISVH